MNDLQFGPTFHCIACLTKNLKNTSSGSSWIWAWTRHDKLADESLAKQYCTNISNTVMRQLLLSLWSWETKWSWRDQYKPFKLWLVTDSYPILFVEPNNNTVDWYFKPSNISRAMIRIIWPRGQITVWPHWHIGTEAAALMWGERERVITKGWRREFIGIGARKRNGL